MKNTMKIPPYLTNAIGSAGAVEPKTSGTDRTAAGNGSTSSDRVQLSQNYQNIANAQKSISGTEEIRTDKVQQIQSQLTSGAYQVDAGAVAEKMLDDVI